MEILILINAVLLFVIALQLRKLRTHTTNALTHLYNVVAPIQAQVGAIHDRLRDRFPTSAETEREIRKAQMEIDPNHPWDA